MQQTETLSCVCSGIFTGFPDVVTIEQLCEMLGGISTKTAYKILRNGDIAHIKVGRSYRIPKYNIVRYLGM